MTKTALGVFCIALAALLLEINLIRVFDVLWYPNMAYMVITLAVFSFGLAGVVLAIRPVKNTNNLWLTLSIITALMAVWVLHMQWAIDHLPFDYNLLNDKFGEMSVNFLLIYVVICVPFFLAGLVLSIVFTHYAKQIRRLYFWDLIGAALGCVLLIPLLPKIGTTGIIIVVAGLSVLSAACFAASRRTAAAIVLIVIAAAIVVFPFTRDQIDTFEPHMHKRAFKPLVKQINEGTWWDPISKINVLNTEGLGQKRKWIAYDGGTQTSYFYPFDGDFAKLRASLPGTARQHFWNAYVAVSHYLKADSDARVLIIGSAGGQELKAALTYNAGEVDAIELVGTVVALGKTRYADYTGNIMNHPNANVQRGEGRSYLRQTNKQYDIIQIFSNHTSSSIAAFVAENSGTRDDLPTLLIKMSPWTPEEIAKVKDYLPIFQYPVDPFNPSASFLSDDFFVGELPQSVIDKVPYRIKEPTDNQPFFNSLRLNLDTLPKSDPARFVNIGVSELMNSQKSTGYPIDVMHLIISAGAAMLFALVFTFGPLAFARTGREKWAGKGAFMTYFACLGLGFIVLELVFIQIFMKLIGFPLYTYTVVLFTFLFGAGLGSLASEKLRLRERSKTWVPFAGIVVTALLVVLAKTFLFDHLLELRTLLRIITSFVLIFPLAFFLGMPFPLGILTIENKPEGTVAWAWALNGLFTVTGGIFCAIFSVYYGFIATMTVAVAAYLLAYVSIKRLEASG